MNLYKSIRLMKKLTIYFLYGILLAGSGTALEMAAAAMKAGLFREALVHVDVAQAQDRTNAEVYRLKALLHETIDEPNKAVQAWQSCLENTQDNALINEAKVHIQSLQGRE